LPCQCSKLGADLPASSSPTRPTKATSRAPSSARLARPRATFAALPPGLLPGAQRVSPRLWRMWRLAANMEEQAPPLPGAGAAPQRALQRGHLCFGHGQAAAQPAARPTRVIHMRDAVHHGIAQRYHCLCSPDRRHVAAAMCEIGIQSRKHCLQLSGLLYYALSQRTVLKNANSSPHWPRVGRLNAQPSRHVQPSRRAAACPCIGIERRLHLLDLGAELSDRSPRLAASKTTANSILLPVTNSSSALTASSAEAFCI